MRIEGRKDPVERVVRRDALRERKKRPQPRQPLFAESLDIQPGVAARNGSAKRHDHQVEQLVPTGPLDARIGKIFKRGENGNKPLGHRKTSVS